MSNVQNRYDFVYLFDCQDGNPNGDPDSDNSPRVDPETFQGLVSDVCLKRKIRDYIYQSQRNGTEVKKGYDIYVMAGSALESKQEQAYKHLENQKGAGDSKSKDEIDKARSWMCANFFDVRTFGAVMSTKNFNCGQVRGPAQITFARSVDRIFSTEHTITRQAFTREDKAAATSGSTEIGRKHTVAYGLYLAHGFINPVFAEQTGFSEEDLALLWRAFCSLFELDRSAARGLMAPRGLYIFKHDSKLGSAPAHHLFESVSAKLKDGVVSPRSFSDYTVTVPQTSELPPGITLINGCAVFAAA
jgi:CRISPR-associated protein Csd2